MGSVSQRFLENLLQGRSSQQQHLEHEHQQGAIPVHKHHVESSIKGAENCKPKPFNLKMFQILATQSSLAVPKYPMWRSYVTQSHCDMSDHYIFKHASCRCMNMNYHSLIHASLHYHRCIYENILNVYQSLSGIQEPAAALSVVANANPFSMEKARACTFQVSRFSKLPSKVWNSMNLLYLFCGFKNQRHPTTTDSKFSRNPFHFLWTGSELHK